MNKVVIIVKGGIVQEVYSTGIVDIEVIDLDNDNKITNAEIKEMTKGLVDNL